MSDKTFILTPVGRLVQGSLYEAQTTDMQNNPLTIKTGPNIGQPLVKFFFALAIAKNGEQHWNQTDWGKMIWDEAIKSFPGGQYQSPQFAWKIIDGDSTIPNMANKKPCDNEGFIGHWVLRFTSSFAPTIVNHDGSQYLLEKGFINLGDYIQVYAAVSKNTSAQKPGLFLNHKTVAFAGYGKRISTAPDPKNIGFGKGPIPVGLSPTPVASSTFVPMAAPGNTFPPVTHVSMSNFVPRAMDKIAPIPMTPTPYPQILSPMTKDPVRKLTAKAMGQTYEELIGNGWTDELLIQHGMMEQ